MKNRENDNLKRKIEFYKICGFIIYYEKASINNDKKTQEEEACPNGNENQNNIIIHNIENKSNQTNENNDNMKSNINSKDKSVVGKNENDNNPNNTGKKMAYTDILCQILFPCCDNLMEECKNNKYCCASCKLGFKKCYFKTVDNEFSPIFHRKFCLCKECCSSCKCCQCCECCKYIDLKESYTDQEIFCYVYQIQRKCSWFCDLFFKNNILSLIIHNLCVELGIVGFEIKLNEYLENNNDLHDNFIIMLFYLGIFTVFILIFTKIYVGRAHKKNFAYFSWISTIFSVVICVLSVISYLIEKGKIKRSDKIFNIIILFPVAYTKFINFLVMESLVSILDEDNMDILSNSFILTTIFMMYDIIVFIVTDFLELNSDTLILIQLISGIFIIFCHVISMCSKCLNKNEFEKMKN